MEKKMQSAISQVWLFLTVYVRPGSWYHLKSLHLSLINIYTRSAVMNANLFAFCFFIDFSLSRGSLWKVVRAFWVGGYFNRLTSVILIRQRKVHFAETEESFLLLEMQPERVFQQLVFCFLPELMCMLASSFASKRLLFCIVTCQTLDWIRWGWLIWVLVRLLTQFFFFFFFYEPFKRWHFHKRHLSQIQYGTWGRERWG